MAVFFVATVARRDVQIMTRLLYILSVVVVIGARDMYFSYHDYVFFHIDSIILVVFFVMM